MTLSFILRIMRHLQRSFVGKQFNWRYIMHLVGIWTRWPLKFILKPCSMILRLNTLKGILYNIQLGKITNEDFCVYILLESYVCRQIMWVLNIFWNCFIRIYFDLINMSEIQQSSVRDFERIILSSNPLDYT